MHIFPVSCVFGLWLVSFGILSCKQEKAAHKQGAQEEHTIIYRDQSTETASGDAFGQEQDSRGSIDGQATPDSKGSTENNSEEEGRDAKEAGSWSLVWSDEFEGVSLDQEKWGYEQNCWGGGNDELQCYTDREDNVFVRDGQLHIVAKKETFTGADGPEGNGDPKTMGYTSGRVRTKGKGDFLYGKICARAKLPYGQGLWPAIWMLPTNPVEGLWAASGEIDIMEAVNLPTSQDGKASVHGTLHYGASWPNNVHSGEEYVFEDGKHPGFEFHDYCVEWEEGEIRWYIDDKHYATQNKWYSKTEENGETTVHKFPKPFDKEFHIILNVAVGGAWPGPPDAQSTFPQSMILDWVRVYECGVDQQTGRGCKKETNIEPLEGAAVPDIPLRYPLDEFEEVIVYGDEGLSADFEILNYAPEGSQVTTMEVMDVERGDVLSVRKTGSGQANVYAHFVDGFFADLSDWADGTLVFDVQVETVARDLRVKIDSGWPQTSDVTVENIPAGLWRTIRVPIQDLFDGDNSVEPGHVSKGFVVSPLVIEPMDEGDWSMKIDQIRLEKF